MTNGHDLLQKYSIDTTQISSVEWITSDSKDNSALFYKFNKHSEEELRQFKQRINGCSFVFCITNAKQKFNIPTVISVDDDEFYSLQSLILEKIYPLKPKHLKLIGVTGTNGKTTCVDLIRQCFLQQKKEILTIGTLGVYLGEVKLEDFSLTTPSLIDLHKTLFKYLDEGGICALEMSSHALEQQRFGELGFHRIGFTNLSQDHLDYHKNMSQYLAAKMKIFNHVKEERDVYIPQSQVSLIKEMNKQVSVVNVKKYSSPPFFKTIYNQENLCLCLALIADEIKERDIDVSLLIPPAGRFNIFPKEDSFIVVDFAHTPEALYSLGTELQSSFKGYNIITIFGCGGNRDSQKRSLMGEAASKFSDYIILTNDNPRLEDPELIVEDIKVGITIKFEIILNRADAIEKGVGLLQKSVLIVAGKGHEDYIDQAGRKTPYSDIEEVKKYLND